MKKFVPLLLAALLLCALFTCASAKTVTASETFTAGPEKQIDFTMDGEHFSLFTRNKAKNAFLWGAWSDGSDAFSITSKDGTIIDRIEARVSLYGDYYEKITVKPGHKLQTGNVNNGETVHIDYIESTSFGTNGTHPVYVDQVVVYYHTEVPDPAPSGNDSVPKTGDTAAPVLYALLMALGAAGIVLLRRKEAR